MLFESIYILTLCCVFKYCLNTGNSTVWAKKVNSINLVHSDGVKLLITVNMQ